MNLSEILEHHFVSTTGSLPPGIRTRENEQTGKMEIFDWPKALGPKPTKADIGVWTAEFNARPAPKKNLNAGDIWRTLRTKGFVADTDLPTDVEIPV